MTATTALVAINHWSLWARRVRVHGQPLRASSLDRLVYLALHRLGVMGRADRRFFAAHVEPGMIVADIGANVGVYTLLFSRLVGPAGRVVAFEPDPRVFAALTENCRAAPNVEAVRAAVGATRGRVALRSGGLNSGDNRIVQNGPVSERKQWVDAVVFDDAVGPDVDFVKVDVQGREMDVFRGMTAHLGKVPLLFEFWPFGLREAGTDPRALLAYLTDAGYRLSEPDGPNDGPSVDAAGLVRRLGARSYTNLFATPR